MFFDFFNKEPKNIAIFVDGPNMIRKEVKIDLAKVKEEAKKIGNVVIANVYLDQYAPLKLIEAVINQGFTPVISSGDVDVAMAVDIVYYAMLRKDIKGVLVVTRDTDFISAIKRVKEYGKQVYVATSSFGMSKALKNYADELIMLKAKRGKGGMNE